MAPLTAFRHRKYSWKLGCREYLKHKEAAVEDIKSIFHGMAVNFWPVPARKRTGVAAGCYRQYFLYWALLPGCSFTGKISWILAYFRKHAWNQKRTATDQLVCMPFCLI